MRHGWLTACFALTTWVGVQPGLLAQNGTEYNVLLIVADDMGTEYVGAYSPGVTYTPSIDSLAADGMRFDVCWATPLCSPSRACIQTGKYPVRNGVRRLVSPPSTTPGGFPGTPCTSQTGVALSTSVSLQYCPTDFPVILSAGGIANRLVGKWHLDWDNPACQPWGPCAHGYESFLGITGGATRYYNWTPWEQSAGGLPVQLPVQHEYITTVLADDAAAWISDQEQEGNQWFCFLSFTAPHDPFRQCPPPNLTPTQTGCTTWPMGSPPPCPSNLIDNYKAKIEAMDTEIGNLLQHINALGARDDTLIIFTSDNGTPPQAAVPPDYDPTTGCPNVKGTPFEGGIHVPLIVSGPEVAIGSTDALVHLIDLHPTILDWCGLPQPQPPTIDGLSLRPVLTGQSTVHHPEIFSDIGPGEAGVFFEGTATCRFMVDQGHPGFCAVRNDQYKLTRYLATPTGSCYLHVPGSSPAEWFVDLKPSCVTPIPPNSLPCNPDLIGLALMGGQYDALQMALKNYCDPDRAFVGCPPPPD